MLGRDRELAAVRELSREARLLTIWGAGGVGKTRLAQSLARTEGEHTFVCDLSDAGDLIELSATVAYRLGVVLDGDDPLRCVGRWLARRGAALLVLDNFEQLAHLAPVAIGRFLDEAPALRVVVTSRERLRLPDEVCFELAPLALPRDSGELEASPAFQLLRARLRAIDPSFELRDEDGPALVTLLASLTPVPGPGDGNGFLGVYDVEGRRLIVFRDGPSFALSLDGTPHWEQLTTVGAAPEPGFAGGMAALYDREGRRMLVFVLASEGTSVHALSLDETLAWHRFCPDTVTPAPALLEQPLHPVLQADGVYLAVGAATWRFELATPYCD